MRHGRIWKPACPSVTKLAELRLPDVNGRSLDEVVRWLLAE